MLPLILNIISGSALRGSSKVVERVPVSPGDLATSGLTFQSSGRLIGNGGERYQASLNS